MIRIYHFKNNYGDDLAYFLLKKLANDRVEYCIPFDLKRFVINLMIWGRDLLLRHVTNTFPWPYAFRKKVLLVTGSILGLAKKNCIVWGCGITCITDRLSSGIRVAAVRGPYALDAARKAGIDVSETVLGDPGLLLPLLLPDKCISKKYSLGIIAHINDAKSFHEHFHENPQIRFIDLNTLHHSVEEITEAICSCRYILSSSLHGLIVSHAYGIPALRIDSRRIQGDGIKFTDYFFSVGIRSYQPLPPEKIAQASAAELEQFFMEHAADALPSADLDRIRRNLLQSAPFPLKPEFYSFLKHDRRAFQHIRQDF